MARIESDINLGFFPTSNKTMKDFLSKFFGTEKARSSEITICDPCCGEGEILREMKEFFPMSKTYGIELDSVRAKIANEKIDVFVCSDALTFKKSKRAFDFLFLNPPYMEIRGIDGKNKRVEGEFVRFWRESVKIGGYMLLVITQNSISSSSIPLLLLESGYEIEKVFIDRNNEDYQRFGQYFILLKRVAIGQRIEKEEKGRVIEYEQMLSIDVAEALEEMSSEEYLFVQQQKEMRIIFSPMQQLEKWQILDLVKKNDKKIFESKIKQSLAEIPPTSIESPNDGQAIILLMAGLVENTIADRFIVRGECKKAQTSRQIEEDKISHRDHYVGEMFVFDVIEKRFLKLS